jgi:hypothetical protein
VAAAAFNPRHMRRPVDTANARKRAFETRSRDGFGPRNGPVRALPWRLRAFHGNERYSEAMRRSRAPFVTAVYEERAATNRPIQAAADELHKHFECDLCGKDCEGDPAGSGLLLWFRGDELRVDEPPLCEECARRVTIGAVSKWALEDEEEG